MSIRDWVVPPADATDEEQRDWQWRIAVSIVGMYGVGGILIAAALGQIVGVSGFASAQEVAQAQQVLKEVRLDQIRNRMDQIRLRQCQAIQEGNVYAMQLAVNALQGLINQHYAMSSFNYRIPECYELIPGAYALRPETPAPTVRPGTQGG